MFKYGLIDVNSSILPKGAQYSVWKDNLEHLSNFSRHQAGALNANATSLDWADCLEFELDAGNVPDTQVTMYVFSFKPSRVAKLEQYAGKFRAPSNNPVYFITILVANDNAIYGGAIIKKRNNEDDEKAIKVALDKTSEQLAQQLPLWSIAI